MVLFVEPCDIISIHAPREGSDRHSHDIGHSHSIFQSTLPVRGATLLPVLGLIRRGISIHAPREGSDGGIVCR